MASLPWMLKQEDNLIYVAVTRAIENLIEVTVKEN
jgi:superfamily I DNA/RNA helicase